MFAQNTEDFLPMCLRKHSTKKLEALSVTILVHFLFVLFTVKIKNKGCLSLKCHLLKFHVYELLNSVNFRFSVHS